MPDLRLGKYKHYKGGLYEVLGTVVHSETKEKMILYKQLYNTDQFKIGQLWVRPKTMFLEEVDLDNQKVPRFKFLEK